MTYQTNINDDKKCDNIMTWFHYTNLINVYNIYKDDAIKEKDKEHKTYRAWWK